MGAHARASYCVLLDLGFLMVTRGGFGLILEASELLRAWGENAKRAQREAQDR